LEKEPESNHVRMFGCLKCGSPFFAYPPDDMHKLASRNNSSFSETVQVKYVCAKCKEINGLYWGKPVHLRGVKVALTHLFQALTQVIGQVIKIRIPIGKANKPTSETSSMDVGSPADLDNEIYDYILSNGGAIAVNQASEDLGVPPELIREALERLSSDGRLKQQMAAGDGIPV
jgi:hypothetical protein